MVVTSRKITAVALIVLLPAGLLWGCATIQENPKTATGAAVGAVGGAAVGAAIGAAAGRPGTGALIGGLAGVLAGGLIGAYLDRQDRTREATMVSHNYRPDQGTLLRIERVEAMPRSVAPGQKVNLSVTYAVIEPDPNRVVAITETREIRQNGNIVGNPSITVNRAGGTYTSTVPLTLPAGANPGTYNVITRVQAPNAADAVSTSFTVARERTRSGY